jgi:hypothetical protein
MAHKCQISKRSAIGSYHFLDGSSFLLIDGFLKGPSGHQLFVKKRTLSRKMKPEKRKIMRTLILFFYERKCEEEKNSPHEISFLFGFILEMCAAERKLDPRDDGIG